MVELDYNDTVSIVVPVYNVKPYLGRCLESLIRQSYEHLDIVLVNDGSTDGSGDVCDRFAKSDDRIRVIHKANGGLSEARNVGFGQIHGQLVTFIDSDDYVTNDFIEVMYRNLVETGADVSCVGFERVHENTPIRTVETGSRLEMRSTFSPDEALFQLFHQRGVTTSAWGKLYRASLFEGISYPVGAHHEDLPVTYRLFAKSHRITTSPARCYMYLERSGSITQSGNSAKRLIALTFAQQAVESMQHYPSQLHDAAITRLFAEAIYIVAQADLKGSDQAALDEAWKYVVRHSRRVLQLKEARSELRLYALLSTLGPAFVRVAYVCRQAVSQAAWKIRRKVDDNER